MIVSTKINLLYRHRHVEKKTAASNNIVVMFHHIGLAFAHAKIDKALSHTQTHTNTHTHTYT